MQPGPHCNVPTIGLIASKSQALPIYNPLNVQAALLFGGIVVTILLLRLIFGRRHKAERGATLAAVWAICALISGRDDLAAGLVCFGSGCAVAASVPAPYWLYRATGSRERLVMGAFTSFSMLICLELLGADQAYWKNLLSFSLAGVAILLFICGDQAWDIKWVRRRGRNACIVMSGIFFSLLGTMSADLELVGGGLIVIGAMREAKAYWDNRGNQVNNREETAPTSP